MFVAVVVRALHLPAPTHEVVGLDGLAPAAAQAPESLGRLGVLASRHCNPLWLRFRGGVFLNYFRHPDTALRLHKEHGAASAIGQDSDSDVVTQ